MSKRANRSGQAASAGAPRLGFFGLLGSGNLGNDGSFEAVFTRLRADHPDVVIDAMCMGPERMSSHYGVPAIPLFWSTAHSRRTHGVRARILWALGKGIDAWRTFRWVRQHDLVVVAGAGVLENSLPVRATGIPYAMFLLSASGRIAGTKVALLAVGATKIKQRPTRWLRNVAAHLAYYRSYRDRVSWDVMQQSGAFARHDPVYTDLVFSLPAPRSAVGDPRLVGVGIMAYFGGSDDRRHSQEIHERYIEAMTGFVFWLVDQGYGVRLLPGDGPRDAGVIASVLTDISTCRPALAPGQVVAHSVTSLGDLLEEIAPVGSVVGARYHNVVCGLRLSKPTISVGYSLKHAALMADMGVPEFALSARSVSAPQLIEQFTVLQRRLSEVHATLETHQKIQHQEIEGQFEDLAALLDSAENGLRPRHTGEPDARQVRLVERSVTT
jgi:polysaccharide pyruvyl transferase WcaK-like protein